MPQDQELSEQAVKDYVKANLARYKVPREVVFLAELPRNATGKVLKRELSSADRAAVGSSVDSEKEAS